MSLQNPSLPLSGAHAPTLSRVIRAATARIRFLMALRYGSRALLVGAVSCVLYVAAMKLRLAPEQESWKLACLLAGSVFLGVLLAFSRRLTPLDVAKLTERRADMKERFSSALEFQAQRNETDIAFIESQFHDADQHAARVNLREIYPLRVSWELPTGVVISIGLFLMFFLPTLPAFWSAKHKQEVADVKRRGIAIVRLAQDTKKAAEQQKLDETKKAAEEARKLGEAMEKGKLSKKQSFVEMQKLTKKMEETQKRLAASLPPKSMEQARNEFKRSLDRMQKQIEDSQKKKADEAKKSDQAQNAKKAPNKNSEEAKKQAESNAMKQAKQALQQMAQALAEQDHKQMQQAMEKLARQMESGQMSKQEMQQMKAALQQLAQALKDTNMNASAKQLEQMAQSMSSMGNIDPKSLQQMAEMMRSIGKGMGKGDGFGQAELDAKMMADLEKALKNGSMTMAMGNGRPGYGGNGPGRGFGGTGHPTKAMKDPGATSPRLIAMGKKSLANGIGKSGSATEFARYLAMHPAAAAHLPNGKIVGARSQNGNELQTYMTGDPEPTRSNAPYYQAYQTTKKQAENALNKENIPATYKKQVRDYFDSIKP